MQNLKQIKIENAKKIKAEKKIRKETKEKFEKEKNTEKLKKFQELEKLEKDYLELLEKRNKKKSSESPKTLKTIKILEKQTDFELFNFSRIPKELETRIFNKEKDSNESFIVDNKKDDEKGSESVQSLNQKYQFRKNNPNKNFYDSPTNSNYFSEYKPNILEPIRMTTPTDSKTNIKTLTRRFCSKKKSKFLPVILKNSINDRLYVHIVGESHNFKKTRSGTNSPIRGLDYSEFNPQSPYFHSFRDLEMITIKPSSEVINKYQVMKDYGKKMTSRNLTPKPSIKKTLEIEKFKLQSSTKNIINTIKKHRLFNKIQN